MTDGIEVCTGPLGQGVANGVGLAVAEAHLAASFNKPDFAILDNYTYVLCGDGCLQEGVASEAASLAGHLGLGRLIMLYDDNQIQIDGGTDLAFTEDVLKRFEAYGWHIQSVHNGDSDLDGIDKAITAAKLVTDKPSIIKIKTTIGFAAKLQGTEKVHGAPLGAEEIAAVKKKLGFDPEKSFFIPDAAKKMYAGLKDKGLQLESEWNQLLQKYTSQYPQMAAELQRRSEGKFPANWKDNFPKFTPSDAAVATRKSSENVLNAIAEGLPELMGGSADLTHSNLTRWKTAVDFQKESSGIGNYGGRYMRFGVREHGMAGICNGMAAYGCLIPFGATFLNFLGYAQGAFRLSALSGFRILYIMTHDSIGLGEDGPTHQPMEILPLVRATPHAYMFRPADGNEVSGSYISALEYMDGPSVLSLSRQNLPNLAGSSIEKVSKGGYVLQDVEGYQVVLVGTGSETSLCVETAALLAKDGIKARVVSMPCWELFDNQSLDYKLSVFTVGSPIVSVEASSTFGWEKYAHVPIGINTFGSSGPAKDLYKKFGLVPDVIGAKVKKVVDFYKKNPVANLLNKPF